MKFRDHKKGTQKGFTLIEMIVASSVFIITMLIIIGALISLNNASHKARAVRVVMDNLSAATDSMSRNIRMGSKYHCGCGDGGWLPSTPGDAAFPGGTRECPMLDTQGNGGEICFAFEGQLGDPASNGDQIVYRLANNRIERSTDGGLTYIPLTAPEIFVKNLRFFVYGTNEDQDQPSVTMLIQGTANLTQKTRTDFNIQTTIGARTPNFSSP